MASNYAQGSGMVEMRDTEYGSGSNDGQYRSHLPYMMGISILIQSQGYDQRAPTSAAMAKAPMAPQFSMPLSYTPPGPTSGMIHYQAQPQQSLYSNYSYNTTGNAILPKMDYLQRWPQSHMLNRPPAGLSSLPYSLPKPQQTYMSGEQTTC